MCLAIPAQVVGVVDEPKRLAQVEVGGVRREVSVGLLEGQVESGEWVLMHVGFAIARVDEAEAQATLALLAQMGAEYEQQLAELRESVIE